VSSAKPGSKDESRNHKFEIEAHKSDRIKSIEYC
jgi:hypothetical protein